MISKQLSLMDAVLSLSDDHPEFDAAIEQKEAGRAGRRSEQTDRNRSPEHGAVTMKSFRAANQC